MNMRTPLALALALGASMVPGQAVAETLCRPQIAVENIGSPSR